MTYVHWELALHKHNEITPLTNGWFYLSIINSQVYLHDMASIL